VTPETASRSGLRHGEDRLEGASQRPYPLSSSAAHPEQSRSEDTSLYLRSPCTRVVEARVRGWVSRPVEGLSPPTNPWRSLAVASRERSFLPWAYSPLRGSLPMSRWKRSLPRFRSHRRFRRSPHPSLRLGEDMSSGLCVCATHQLCARGKPRALASLGFLTSKSGGLWRVCSRTSAMPLGRLHQRRLSALFDSLRRFVQGIRGIASVVLVCANRASRSSPLCWWLLVGLYSIRRAAIVTDAGYTDPDRASLDS